MPHFAASRCTKQSIGSSIRVEKTGSAGGFHVGEPLRKVVTKWEPREVHS